MSTRVTRPKTEEERLELDNLLREAQVASRVGDRAEAETILRQALSKYPYSEDVMLALAGVVEGLEEKRDLFVKVYDQNPANEEARQGMERLNEKLGPPATPVNDEVEEILCVCGSGQTTLLHCGKCGKPICSKCSVRTPVGLRCKECAQVRRSPVYSLSAGDYVKAGAVGLGLSLLASIILGAVGGFLSFFGWLIAFFVGGAIAEAMSRAIRMKRGVGMQILAGACLVAAMVVAPLLLSFLPPETLRLLGLRGIGINLFTLIAAVAGAVVRLR